VAVDCNIADRPEPRLFILRAVEWRRRFRPLGEIGAPAQALAVRAAVGARLAQLRAWARALDEEQIVAAWEALDVEPSRWS
jgi:hypothetical protein